ncbi:glycosyltransferase [Desulfosarcina ovata]|uniref:Glycosyltransferase 2-like domain-containing protein n=1 Tax=Desulfosarcina ovata subsp. ovata TaxID=2752305 RepID=A0A5K8A6U5_9BACT|nr:glycosyltransferase [Desulfosarcina ovata]BBO88332.1 hypothetical protein DSCOOX_15120 [Desulfosarcina ovata subsp. ovata]
MKPKNISIVIPFHQEEASLKELIPRLMEVIRSLENSVEVILVDDASSDGGATVVESFRAYHPEIRLIRLKTRGGQTGCYRAAFEQAQGDYILRMDADLQDDPRDLPRFMEKIADGYELIMGLREARKHPRLLRAASMVYDLLVLLLFNSPLHSNSGSYVAFRADLVKNIPYRRNDHRYLSLIAMRRGAKRIGEVFVRHNERQWGVSKYRSIKKVILGIPEVIMFMGRYLLGVYDLQ